MLNCLLNYTFFAFCLFKYKLHLKMKLYFYFKRVLLSFLITGGLYLSSCEKEPLLEDPTVKLVFSTDTVLFDTIFTTIGSVTRHFKVFNPYNKSILISSVSLSGDTGSPYRINVDGMPGRSFSDLKLRGGDSIYVFVETTIDPVGGDLPMVVEDSVVFVTNGNIQDVKLVAWGQDVNVINGEIFNTGTLTAGKPYLVYNSMMVDTGQVLSLEPGVRMHFHRDSRLFVAGTILAEGSPEHPVTFEGARTESAYRDIPGQWEGIWLMPGSSGNRFVHSRIRNAFNGIIADTVASPGSITLYLANSRIENMTSAGLYARGTTVYSYNTVISNCGFHNVALTIGGDYTFYHCTFANYWNFSTRTSSSLVIVNYYTDINDNINLRPVKALFGNTIIHGSRGQELEFFVHPDAGFDVEFNHSLVRVQSSYSEIFDGIFNNCIFEKDPGFIDPTRFNFRLSDDSPAIDAGDPLIGIIHPFDFDGKSRTDDIAPDIGAFEWVEEPDEEN